MFSAKVVSQNFNYQQRRPEETILYQAVAFSCKERGFCPSCGSRRMAEGAAKLVDGVLPEQRLRQWVLSFPYNLRFLFAFNPNALSIGLEVTTKTILSSISKSKERRPR